MPISDSTEKKIPTAKKAQAPKKAAPVKAAPARKKAGVKAPEVIAAELLKIEKQMREGKVVKIEAMVKTVPAAGPFQPGSTKEAIFDVIKDGKVHPRSDLLAIVEKAGKGKGLIYWVLKEIPAKGYKILQNDKDGVQIAAAGK